MTLRLRMAHLDRARGGAGHEGIPWKVDGPLEAVDEVDEVGLLATAQSGEVVAGGESLSVVGEDRILERLGAAVVQEAGPDPGAPEGGRPHLLARGAVLRDPVVQAPHVVEQEVR